jgi:hypothetical protein
MKKAILLVVVLAACGGNGPDYGAAYVGLWSLSATVTVSGSSTTSTYALPVEETDTNVLVLHGFCSAIDPYGDGPVADVTSSGFTLRASSCSFSDPADCSTGSVGFSVSHGQGSLSDGTLSGSLEGTLSCGASSLEFTLTFTSSEKGAYGSTWAGSPKGLASALRLLQ